jgi:hypothetical protein
VASHSGYFTVRQFLGFAGARTVRLVTEIPFYTG